jgi:hypothetical protein
MRFQESCRFYVSLALRLPVDIGAIAKQQSQTLTQNPMMKSLELVCQRLLILTTRIVMKQRS